MTGDSTEINRTSPAGLAWLRGRSSGVLLHPSSLHGDQGVGVLGQAAQEFVEFLVDANIRYWQMLPLGPTGYGDSPYSSYSAFAGNPYLIDLQPLLDHAILKPEEVQPLRGLSQKKTDFAALYRIKWPLLRLAHKRFMESKRKYLPNYGLLEEFCEKEKEWLEPFVAYMGFKERFGGAAWQEWPEECRNFASARNSAFWDETAQSRSAHQFFQYLFYGQWTLLREYAHARGVRIIGDAPIFVALDGADVWSYPELFQLSSSGKPTHVAGVPPDYFSKTGQLWGNPLYDWKRMKATGFKWWIDRLKANFALFDVIRLDHFLGFFQYWRIPAEAKDARSGKWTAGPKDALFEAINKEIPEARFIAEDLGDINRKILDFRDRLGLPGMAVLQFAFGGGNENPYLPHNLQSHSVLYPGTHDNNTTLGWYDAADEPTRDHVRRYLRVSGEDIAWDFIRSAFSSVSGLVVIPMQDLLVLDESARMNHPGESLGNWKWRMTTEQFQEQRMGTPYLRELAWLYGRQAWVPETNSRTSG